MYQEDKIRLRRPGDEILRTVKKQGQGSGQVQLLNEFDEEGSHCLESAVLKSMLKSIKAMSP